MNTYRSFAIGLLAAFGLVASQSSFAGPIQWLENGCNALQEYWGGNYDFKGNVKAENIGLISFFSLMTRTNFNAVDLINEIHDKHGPIAYVRKPWSDHPVVFINRGDMAKQILMNTDGKANAFDRDLQSMTSSINTYGADNVSFTKGQAWREHRQMLAKYFGVTRIRTPEFYKSLHESLSPIIEDIRAQIRSASSGAAAVDLEPILRSAVMRMTLKSFFGLEKSLPEIRDSIGPAFEVLTKWIVLDSVLDPVGIKPTNLPKYLPFTNRVKSALEVVNRLTDEIMNQNSNNGLMGELLSNPNVNREMVRNNVLALIAGANEATSSYATWMLHDVTWHRDVLKKIVSEVDGNTEISPANRDKLKTFGSANLETLRMHSPFYLISRQATQDFTFSSEGQTFVIPEGTHVVISLLNYHLSEGIFGKDASGFSAAAYNPHRWETPESKANKVEECMMPFGAGPRSCIGRFAAEAEVEVLITRIIKEFDIVNKSPAWSVPVSAGLATKPRDGLPVSISERR